MNLFWAIDRMKQVAAHSAGKTSRKRLELLLEEARTIDREDREMCDAIGRNGAELLSDGMGVLTHCNAGSLATAGNGTALSVFFAAHAAGKKIHVYADETRPLAAGSPPHHVGTDAAEYSGHPDLRFNGRLGHEGRENSGSRHRCRPNCSQWRCRQQNRDLFAFCSRKQFTRFLFNIAAPSSTFDFHLESGEKIPIEERAPEEITCGFGKQTAPDDVKTYSPAFDVTPAENLTALITEKGIIQPVTTERIKEASGRMKFALIGDHPEVDSLLREIRDHQNYQLEYAACLERPVSTIQQIHPDVQVLENWEQLLTFDDIDAFILAGCTRESQTAAKTIASETGQPFLIVPLPGPEWTAIYDFTYIQNESSLLILPLLKFRFHPHVETLRKKLDQRVIGQISRIEFHQELSANQYPESFLKTNGIRSFYMRLIFFE